MPPLRPARGARRPLAPNGSPDRYDADLFDTFERVAAPFPVGTEVPLPHGGTGVVADADVADPWQPVVRLPAGGQRRVDLTHLDASRVTVA